MLQCYSLPAEIKAEGAGALFTQAIARVCTQNWDPENAPGSVSLGIITEQLQFPCKFLPKDKKWLLTPSLVNHWILLRRTWLHLLYSSHEAFKYCFWSLLLLLLIPSLSSPCMSDAAVTYSFLWLFSEVFSGYQCLFCTGKPRTEPSKPDVSHQCWAERNCSAVPHPAANALPMAA